MSTVKIVIKGLGICYREDEAWKVRFVCDSEHTLLFTAKNESGTIVDRQPLIDASRISIKIINGVVQSETELADFGMVFDLTGNYCHRNGIKTSSGNRSVKPVEMVISDSERSNAVFCTEKPTANRYFVRKVGTAEITRVGYVAKEVGIIIDLEREGLIKFEVEGIDLGPYTFAGDTSIILDNDCQSGEKQARKRKDPDKFGTPDLQSDFHLYYGLIMDIDEETEYEVDVYEGVSKIDRGRVNCYAVRLSNSSAIIPI